MKPLVCEMCGSKDVIECNGMFLCQSCGPKYSAEEIRNLYELARRAKEAKNNEIAAKYYDMILIKDPSSWEANFFAVYFKAMTCKPGEIESAATAVSDCIYATFALIRDHVADTEARRQAVVEVKENAHAISRILFNAARNRFDKIDASIRTRYQMEYVKNGVSAAAIRKTVCHGLCEILADDAEVMTAVGIDILKNRIAEGIAIDADCLYVRVIKKYDTSYQAPKNQTAEDIMKSLK